MFPLMLPGPEIEIPVSIGPPVFVKLDVIRFREREFFRDVALNPREELINISYCKNVFVANREYYEISDEIQNICCLDCGDIEIIVVGTLDEVYNKIRKAT